jgi:hypothetical protein
VTYKARGSTKLAEVNILEKHLGYVDAHSNRSWANDALAIPALPPSDLSNCNNIDLNYYIRVSTLSFALLVMATKKFNEQCLNVFKCYGRCLSLLWGM